MPVKKSPSKRDFHPKKSLGQNFLVDKNTRERIVAACDLNDKDVVLEIGPGRGALSRLLAHRVKMFYAIEKDRELYRYLQGELKGERIHLIRGDFLKFDLTPCLGLTKIIGNLPYNISSPIIIKILESRTAWKDAYLTVQEEFAKRLTARPHNKDYGALTCFVEYHCEAKILFRIKNTCFRPKPKVNSSFVHLKPRSYPDPAKNDEWLFSLIRRLFQQRRKMVGKTLGLLIGRETAGNILQKLHINEKARPEDLALDEYIRISNYINLLGRNQAEEGGA